MVNAVVGVDLGGTSTKFGLITKEGEILCKTSIITDSSIGYDSFFPLLADQIDALKKTLDYEVAIRGIGIGAPDANSKDGKIHHASNLAWTGVIPVVEIMEAKTHLQTTLMNDANAAAIGEMLFGVARGMKDFIAITLGTGLGSGIVSNGEIVLGYNSHAGELGHTIAFCNGRACGCGKRGCLETYASATGIVRTVKDMLITSNVKSSLQNLPAAGLTAKQITDAARNGDTLALEAFAYTARVLGMKLAEFVAFSGPEAFIFSGGLTKAGDILLEPTKRNMEEHLMDVYKNQVKILNSGLEVENAAILGAAASIWKKIERKSHEMDSGNMEKDPIG